MKKTNLLAALAVIAALCGCSRGKTADEPRPVQKLTLTASIAAPTRAVMAEGAEGVLKTSWAEDDVIRVYNLTTKTHAAFEIDQRSEDNLTATFTGEISTEGGQLYATLGCYNPGNVYDGEGQVIGYGPQTRDLGYYYWQTGNGGMGHLDYFAILYGAFTPQSPTIYFRHTMAFFKFTLTLPEGEIFPQDGSAEITLDVPTSRYPNMNLTDGSYYQPGTWSTGILRVTVAELSATDESVVAYMAVPPSDAGGREIALKMEVSAPGSNSVAYGLKLAAKTPRLIEGGKYYTVTEQLELLPLENAEAGGIATLTPQEF